MNDDKIRISPDALIAMIVTEAQDRELARMPSLEEMNEDFQPSEKFQRKMEALVRDTKRKAERKKRLLNVKRFFITLTAAISIFSCTISHFLRRSAISFPLFRLKAKLTMILCSLTLHSANPIHTITSCCLILNVR